MSEQNLPTPPTEENTPQEAPTLEDWRELGSAEANAWTITPPGGQPMSLSEHHASRQAEEDEYQEEAARQRAALEEQRQVHRNLGLLDEDDDE